MGDQEGPIFKYVCTKLKSGFLTSQDEYFDHANFCSPDQQWNAANGQSSELFVVGAPHPLNPPCFYLHMVNTPWLSPFLSLFHFCILL